MFRVTLLIAVLALGCIQVAAEAGVSPPEGAVVFKNPSSNKADIRWLPPVEGPADSYKVYGRLGETSYLLIEVSEHSVSVSNSYSGYFVTAVRDGTESDPSMTVCVATDSNVPFVHPRLDGNC